jgi:hypothetical protein
MLVGGVIVKHCADDPADGHNGLNPVQKTNEFLVPMARHTLANNRTVEDKRGEHCNRAVPDIIVGHRVRRTLLDRQARLSAVERLDLRSLVTRRRQALSRLVEIKPSYVAQLGGKGRIL